MNSVKCKTENMAARDYCLLWGCPGMVILTISLLVSLKVGNDFGQDNFAKFVTFVISSGLLGTVYYLFQSLLAEVPLRFQNKQRQALMLLTNQEAEVVTEDSTNNMSIEQVHECLAEVLPQTESAQESLLEEQQEPTIEIPDATEPSVEVSDVTGKSSELPDLYAQRCKEYQREQEQRRQDTIDAIMEYVTHTMSPYIYDNEELEKLGDAIRRWADDCRHIPLPIRLKSTLTTLDLRHFVWNIAERLGSKKDYTGRVRADFIKRMFPDMMKDLEQDSIRWLQVPAWYRKHRDDVAMLPGEERRERVHKSKAVLEAERQAKDAIARNQMENERLEGQKEKMASEVQDMRRHKDRLEEQNDKLVGEIQNKEQHKERLEGNISQLEDYAAALDIKEEDLIVPTLNTNPLVKEAWDDIKEELGKPIPAFGQKELREERRKAIKTILTELQTALMEAKEAHNKDILKLGKSLYHKAMQKASAIIEQNKQLQKENGRLTEENDVLRKRIASMDENAITRLCDKKDAEIKELQERVGKAESEAVRSSNKAYSEHQRAENAESQVREMMDIPEIKEIWESIQQNKEAFSKQIDKWIEDGVAAIRDFEDGKDNDFRPEAGNAVAWGIIAEAFRYGLDPTDKKQRKMAAAYLLEKVSWTGISSDFKISLTASRTQQLCDAMTVSKDLMANLFLAAGGRGSISTGGGGSNGELTNWDGTKKKIGWGV